MKNLFTYLKALWSRVSGLESRQVGVILEEATIEHPFSTHSAPFGTCWQPSGKLHSVVRCAAMLVMLLTLGSGNVWGTDIVIDLNLKQDATYPDGFPTSNGTTSGTYTFGGYSFGFSCNTSVKRAGSSNNYYILIGEAGAAESNASVITFPAISDYKLTEVVITVATTSGTKVKAYIGSTYGTALTGGSEWTFNNSSSGNANVHTWTLSSTSANTAYKMYIVRASGTKTYNGQLAGLKLTYTPVGGGCSDPATALAVSASPSTIYTSETSTLSVGATGNGSAVTYSVTSDNSAYASIVGTTFSATRPGTYRVQASQNASGGTCGGTSTVDITVRYQIKWSVNGDDTYDTGSPTTYIEEHNGKIGTFPTSPAKSACDGSKEFVGWTATPIVGTTNTKPTFVTPQTQITDNTTLYAVFATRTANSYSPGDINDLINGKNVIIYNANQSKAMASSIQATGKLNGLAVTFSSTNISSPDAALIWTVYNSGTKYIFKSGNNYLRVTSNSANTKLTCDGTSDTWTITEASTGVYTLYSTAGSSTYKLEAYVSGTTYFFTSYSGSGANYNMKFYVPTYSAYVTTCCTPLASINGSVSWSNPTQAVLTWNKMSNVADSDPYTISYRTGSAAYGTTNVSDVDLTGSKATCTITGLNCNTNYDFKIEVAADDGYCDKDTTMTGKNSGKWTITKTGSGSVTGGTFTTKISGSAVTGACSGDQIDIVATNANGYAFSSWTVGKEGGGSVAPDAATASTYFSMPADNVTVTAAFSCVQPSFTVHPASKTDYLTTESATALGYTASAAGASLTQQWQSSSDNSSWSNIVGATNSTYTPDISSEGTTYYRVIVTNSACSESRTSNVATITSVTPTVCKTPTFSVDEGTYNTNKSVTLSCATDGATIYYTTDNSTPTAESTEYTGAISVTQTTTIKAIAVADGLDPSLVASATYTIQCATPTFSVTAGTYVGSKSVEISTTYGTTIYYTTNGDNPTTGSAAYSSAITVGTSQTVKAIAVKTGCTNSAVGSAAYTIQCDAPTFSPAAGTYNANQTVYLSSTYGDNFYYTLDNSTPTTESTLYDSKTGISITESKTIKAIATKTGCDNSSVSSATYTMKCATPTFDVTAGTYTGAQTVAISSTTPGVSIYYTTNGATPTTSSTAYSSAITVSTNQTVKAIAVKDGWSNSAVGEAAYTIKHTITWHVNGSTYSTGVDDGNKYVVDGEKIDDVPTPPSNTTLNNCANKFMGWSSKNAGSTAKTTSYYDDLFTNVAGSPTITKDTAFYAVFAEGEDGTKSLTSSEIQKKYCNTNDCAEKTTSYGQYTIPSDDGDWSGVCLISVNSSYYYVQLNTGTVSSVRHHLESPTYPGYVKKVTVDVKNTAGSGDRTLYFCNGSQANPTTSGNYIGTIAVSPGEQTDLETTFTSDVTSFYIYVDNALQINSIEVDYSTAENYVTQCAANQVRVTYDFNGGTGTACTEGVTTKSASYTVCSTEPEKNYYDFAGWSDGTNTYDAGDTYNLQATTEFTATWNPTVYTITYNLNGGTQQETPAPAASYTYESSDITLPTAPTKGHSRFDGWFDNSGLTGSAVTTIAAGSHGNKEYWAKWTDRHTIVFDADGSETTIYRASDEALNASLAGQGSVPDDPDASGTCSSKVFMGWTETEIYDYTNSAPADLMNTYTGTVSADKHYYAVWATRSGSVGSYTYSAYATTCCDNHVTLSSPSIMGSGTVVFAPVSPAEASPDGTYATCRNDISVTATVTPASGYSCTALSFTRSDSEDVDIDPTISGNLPSAPSAQDFVLSFDKNTDVTVTTAATFTAKGVTGWTWKQATVEEQVDIPATVDLYIGQEAWFDLISFTPSDVISDYKGYTPTYNSDDLAQGGKGATRYKIRAKVAKSSMSLTLTSDNNGSVQEVITIRGTALPTATFVDNIHNKTDFTTGDAALPASGILSATIDGTDKRIVYLTQKTPNHADVAEPGSGNACEKSHLHLVGWIDKDWADEHPNATHSEILGAGTGVYYAANTDIDLSAKNGKTFLAVWSKIE